ncbi:hypothetical protein HanIR_Chr01g0037091 [Helianthus annuus]|nr:hypothetical protein HanIR_Chr01g0037091 [Helianthus annuus]
MRIPFFNCNNLIDFVSQIMQSPGDKTWKKIVLRPLQRFGDCGRREMIKFLTVALSR